MRKDLRPADEALRPGAIATATVSVFDEAMAQGFGEEDIAAVMVRPHLVTGSAERRRPCRVALSCRR
jgi:hypothetical protein